MSADPLVAVKAYKGRALIVSAANDAQVPSSDADRIFATLPGDAKTKTRATIANANHVYKKETRAPALLTPQQIGLTYTDDGHALADGLAEAIVTFVSAK